MNASALARVSFCNAIKTSCKNYANFKGRSRRSEYWKFILAVNILALIILFPLMYFSFVRTKEDYYIDHRYNQYTHEYDT